MNRKLIVIFLFLFLSLPITAENIRYIENNYIISKSQYQLNKKTYNAYKYFKTKQQFLSENFDTLYLMIASSSMQSIGSFGGHAFFVFSKGEEFQNAVALNFYGEHEALNTFEKVILGSTVGLPGYIDIRSFSQIAEKYTIGQERTLFYYKININKKGITSLIDRLYELTEEKLSYQFLNENCADLTIILFEAALNKNLNKETPILLIPSYLPMILERNNLIIEKGTFSPPIVRLNKETLNISKEIIKDKKKFYKENLNETGINDNSEKFIPQKDLYDYGTKLDSYMSQISLGIKDSRPTLGLSFFSSKRFEQIQSPTQALQISFLEFKLLCEDNIKLDSFKVLEFSSYPKINYGFEFTKKFMIMGESDFNQKINPLIRGGLGISMGNSNILFDITTDVDIPLYYFGIQLSLNSEIILYNKNSYIILEGNLPYYQIKSDKDLSIKSKAGFILFNRLNVESSYNWINQAFETSIIWNFNPFDFWK